MGCRPSRRASGKVSDSYWGKGDAEFLGEKSKKGRKNSKNRTYFNKFSTITKTYHRHGTKTSTITLRLSTDGSTLQIEECEIDDSETDPLTNKTDNGNVMTHRALSNRHHANVLEDSMTVQRAGSAPQLQRKLLLDETSSSDQVIDQAKTKADLEMLRLHEQTNLFLQKLGRDEEYLSLINGEDTIKVNDKSKCKQNELGHVQDDIDSIDGSPVVWTTPDVSPNDGRKKRKVSDIQSSPTCVIQEHGTSNIDRGNKSSISLRNNGDRSSNNPTGNRIGNYDSFDRVGDEMNLEHVDNSDRASIDSGGGRIKDTVLESNGTGDKIDNNFAEKLNPVILSKPKIPISKTGCDTTNVVTEIQNADLLFPRQQENLSSINIETVCGCYQRVDGQGLSSRTFNEELNQCRATRVETGSSKNYVTSDERSEESICEENLSTGPHIAKTSLQDPIVQMKSTDNVRPNIESEKSSSFDEGVDVAMVTNLDSDDGDSLGSPIKTGNQIDFVHREFKNDFEDFYDDDDELQSSSVMPYGW